MSQWSVFLRLASLLWSLSGACGNVLCTMCSRRCEGKSGSVSTTRKVTGTFNHGNSDGQPYMRDFYLQISFRHRSTASPSTVTRVWYVLESEECRFQCSRFRYEYSNLLSTFWNKQGKQYLLIRYLQQDVFLRGLGLVILLVDVQQARAVHGIMPLMSQ